MANNNDTLKALFAQLVVNINDKNAFQWGNKILYDMCNLQDEHNKLSDTEQLSARIWLIGRAYAASPERRSYRFGNKDGNAKVADKAKALQSIVRTANDGNGDFFTEISEYLVKEKAYQEVCDKLSKLQSPPARGYTFSSDESAEAENENDIALLAETIQCVCQWNDLLKRVTEKFDKVQNHFYTVPGEFTTSGKAETYQVSCKNQISFCSKFLHFHCPNLVFIIDQFSEIGGVQLFTGKKKNIYLEFGEKSMQIDDPNVRNEFKTWMRYDDPVMGFQKIYDRVIKKLKVSDEASDNDADNPTVERYAKHCVRAYLVARYLKSELKITPNNVYDARDHASPCPYGQSYPRLVDSVLMHIKQK